MPRYTEQVTVLLTAAQKNKLNYTAVQEEKTLGEIIRELIDRL